MPKSLNYTHIKTPVTIGENTVKSLHELVLTLENLSDREYQKSKKRIYTWIKKVLKDDRLARQIKNLHYVENIVKTISSRIQYLDAVEQELEAPIIHVDLPLYINPLRLSWDKDICVGCDICAAICPKEAIDVEESKVSINPDKCVLCGLCVALCPVDAMKIFRGGIEDNPITKNSSIPDLPIAVEINGEKARRLFTGTIDIDETKCPNHCEECVIACPINVIQRDKADVVVDRNNCVLCGACISACPKDTITIKRNNILGEGPGFSALWVKVLEILLGRAKVNIHQNATALRKLATFIELSELKEFTRPKKHKLT